MCWLLICVVKNVFSASFCFCLQEMTEKQTEIEGIQVLYEEEKKQLAELEKKFQELEIEFNKIMEERRIQVRLQCLDCWPCLLTCSRLFCSGRSGRRPSERCSGC